MTSEEQQRMDEQMMRLALKEAERAYEEGEVPVGAVVVCEGRVIARAHNQTERLGDVTAHAEMLAITSAANLLGGKYLTNCTLYVSVEPCVMCAGALGWAQVGRGPPTRSAAITSSHHRLCMSVRRWWQGCWKRSVPN